MRQNDTHMLSTECCRRARCGRRHRGVCDLRADPVLHVLRGARVSRVNMIRQSVENAVYEGSRRGIVPGATAADCRTAAQNVLNTVMARNATINVTPTVITQDTPQVTVAVVVPVNNNSWVAPLFFNGQNA